MVDDGGCHKPGNDVLPKRQTLWVQVVLKEVTHLKLDLFINITQVWARFSIAKRAQLNHTARYYHAAANSNSISTYKHKLEGNTSYPGELMAPERPESAKTDFLVGLVLKRQKEKVDRLLSSSLLSREGWKETPATETVLPTSIRQKPYYRHQSVRNRTTVINPSPSADKSVQGLRLPRLQKERVEGGAARKYQSVYVRGTSSILLL